MFFVPRYQKLQAVLWTGENFPEVQKLFGANNIVVDWTKAGDAETLHVAEFDGAPNRFYAPKGIWLVRTEERNLMVSQKTMAQFFMGVTSDIVKKDQQITRKKVICPFCLADPYHTSTNQNPNMRCPHCAAPYNGRERKEEFQALEAAGLVEALKK